MAHSGVGSRAAVFLDRDGVLIRDSTRYIRSAEQVKLLPGAAESVADFRRAGFLRIIVSNQAAIAHGHITEATLRRINARMLEMLVERDPEATIDGLYYCPYHPEAEIPRFRRNSSFRKPRPGMLLKAARDFKLRLDCCYMVGDRKSDVIAAASVNCVPVLVLTGLPRPREDWSDSAYQPAFTAPDIASAAAWIIDHASLRGRSREHSAC